MRNAFETKEKFLDFIERNDLEYEIQYEEHFGYYINDPHSNIDEVWDNESYRIIIII